MPFVRTGYTSSSPSAPLGQRHGWHILATLPRQKALPWTSRQGFHGLLLAVAKFSPRPPVLLRPRGLILKVYLRIRTHVVPLTRLF